MSSFIQKIRMGLGLQSFPYLRRRVLSLRNMNELKKAMSWTNDPVLDDEDLGKFEHLADLNERRMRDAEVLGTAACNVKGNTILEIGTSRGHTTALLAINAPRAQIHTVNIPPEGIEAGAGGTYTTFALDRSEIGVYYRERGLKNVSQILANTATWSPDIGVIDIKKLPFASC